MVSAAQFVALLKLRFLLTIYGQRRPDQVGALEPRISQQLQLVGLSQPEAVTAQLIQDPALRSQLLQQLEAGFQRWILLTQPRLPTVTPELAEKLRQQLRQIPPDSIFQLLLLDPIKTGELSAAMGLPTTGLLTLKQFLEIFNREDYTPACLGWQPETICRMKKTKFT